MSEHILVTIHDTRGLDQPLTVAGRIQDSSELGTETAVFVAVEPFSRDRFRVTLEWLDRVDKAEGE